MSLEDVFRLAPIMEDQTEDILTATPTGKMPAIKVATKSIANPKPVLPNILPKVVLEWMIVLFDAW